ncbi:MAG: hypothetical protein IJM40_03410 [Synergistaceae bacterium]|nr:hypothetical protein [Synergistaceae bacterium]
MSKRKFNFVLVVFVLVLFALTAGGCGGSSHHSSTSQMERFADTFGEIVDRMQEIASIASSDSAIMAAVQDIIPLYNSSNDQGVIYNIFKLVRPQDIDFNFNASQGNFNARMNYDLTKMHFKYENGKLADGYPTSNNSDFQIEVTNGSHTTTLTLTNSGSTSYWKANAQMSYILSEVAQKAGYISSDVTVLLFNKVYSDINIKLDYKASSSASSVNLLTGTLSFSSDKTDVYPQTPRTTSYKLTITIPGLDNEKLNITGKRVVTNPSSSVMRTDADLSLTKNGENFFSFNAGIDATSSSDKASIKLNELIAKLTDKLALDMGATSSNQINISKLLDLYNTGTSASESEVESNAEAINKLVSPRVYIKNKLNSYIRAFAGTLGNYYHIRLGHQFVDDSLGVIYKLKEIVDEDDWANLQQIIKKLLPQINVITGLMQNIVSDSGDSVIGVNLSQEIIQLLMQHFFAED